MIPERLAFIDLETTGACVGKKAIGLRSARLMAAFGRIRLPEWPYPGRIGLVERDEMPHREEVHVIDGWRHLGSARDEAGLRDLLERSAPSAFDPDIYKRLRSHLAKGCLEVRPL